MNHFSFGGDGYKYDGRGVLKTVVIDPKTKQLVYADGVCASKKGYISTGMSVLSAIFGMGYTDSETGRNQRYASDKDLVPEVDKRVGKQWREPFPFKFYRKEFQNQKIPTGKIYVTASSKTEALLQIQEKMHKIIQKMPIPLKNKEWANEVVNAAEVYELQLLQGDESKVWLCGKVPEGSALEEALINAACSEEWMDKIRRVPQINSVRTGVEDIESFDLKKWNTFLQTYLDGADGFKELPHEDQIGIIKLFEMTNPTVVANAIRKYGKSVWHQMSLSGPLRSRVRLRKIKDDIIRVKAVIDSIAERMTDEKNGEFSSKEGIFAISVELDAAKATLEALEKEESDLSKVTSDEMVAVIEAVLSVTRSQPVSEESPLLDEEVMLLTAGISSASALSELIKNGEIDMISSKKTLKDALMAITYSGVTDLAVAQICARAHVSQEEFLIYQKIWAENRSIRESRVSSFPTLKGEVGNLTWEMCDADDENILTAGNETNCCQHPLSAGGACVYYMVANPSTSTIFRIKKTGSENTIAQSFVWLDCQNRILVFDNIESLGDVRDSIIACYKDYLDRATPMMRLFDVKAATVGTGYTDVALGSFENATGEFKAVKPSNLGYTDIKNGQKVLRKFKYYRSRH